MTDERETVIRDKEVSNEITENIIVNDNKRDKSEREMIGGGVTLPSTLTHSPTPYHFLSLTIITFNNLNLSHFPSPNHIYTLHLFHLLIQ